MSNPPNYPAPDVGPRAITRFLEKIDDGQAALEMSKALQDLMRELKSNAITKNAEVKGKISITLDFTVSPKGNVEVVHTLSRSVPKAKSLASHFWLDKGCNIVTESPQQTRLPLAEVPPPQHDDGSGFGAAAITDKD